MQGIKIEYTVKPEYVETNKANIAKVMSELRGMKDTGILYSTYIKDDGVSFTHFAIVRDPASNIIPNLQTFKAFLEQLRAEGLATPPVTTRMEAIGSSFDL